ncbi:MAG: hypothetical protein BGO12_17355 [Verrucomicrobia bacterium 61-8]|nr:Verru_Chthon cassette protein D [Verrucomicrobiota bacterium]OJV24389.1 MAG: hypothetical protein BGO12_17355 [Verrucomicrobia bacterium 61-8]
MKRPASIRKSSDTAFSLVELLTVIAIIGILVAVTIPSLSGLSSSTELNISGDQMVDTLNLARQSAVSANRPVEVRFYEVPRSADASLAYRAMGIYLLGDDGPSPLGRLAYLQNSIVMSETDAFGTLLSQLSPGQTNLPAIDRSKQFNYRYFVFRPDGSASLPSLTKQGDTWHVMLYDSRRPPTGQTPPDNFVTVQLIPETGRTRTFQPNSR